MTDHKCEILDCGRTSPRQTMNGIRMCERCRVNFESVGLGAVRFGGRWHGVRGARYTPEQTAIFPGLIGGETP